MPNKNGLEVVQEVKQFYLEKASDLGDILIEVPKFAILTAYKTRMLEQEVAAQGIVHLYEKPIY